MTLNITKALSKATGRDMADMAPADMAPVDMVPVGMVPVDMAPVDPVGDFES